MDSTTAIELVTKGPNLAIAGIIIVFITWLYCKINDLLFGDE